MSNKTNRKSSDRKIGNYIFKWEEKTRDGHAYLRIKTISNSWQIRLRDDQECVMMWHELLEDGDCDKALNDWLTSLEMVNTAIGDEIFSIMLAFARNAFVIRHTCIKDGKLHKRETEITSEVLNSIDGWWKSYMELIPDKNISKEDDDKITDSQRKVQIDADLRKKEHDEQGR